jgi:ABC-type dipeptide/oligopeptide/nickel transport system permease component
MAVTGRLSFVLKRIGRSILTLGIVTTVAFVLVRLIPGSPQEALRQQLMQQHPGWTIAQINRRVERYITYNPDKPLWAQYLDYLTSVLQGDLGQSIQSQQPVAEVLGQALPWTLLLLSVATVLTFVLGIVVGALMAYNEGSWFDINLTGVSIFLSSVPYYIFAILFVYLLGFKYSVFPTGGTYPNDVSVGVSAAFVVGVAYHATLPVLSLVLTGWGGQALTMRGNAIRVLGEDFLRVGRLRGITDRRLALRYVTHNSILPMYTNLMISIGFMFGGAVIVEKIFTYKGVGWYMLQAIELRDYPVMMGGFLIITAAVVVTILFADLTYGWIDPRIGTEDSESYGSNQSLLSRIVRAIRGLSAGTRGGAVTGGSPTAGTDSAGPDSITTAGGELETATGERVREVVDLWILTPIRIMRTDRRAQVGFGIFGLYLLVGTVGVWLVEPVSLNEGPRVVPPFQNLAFPFGTDPAGRDIFAQIVHATPAILKMVFAGAVFATTVGTIVGTVAGYVGGRGDQILTGFTDVAMTIPGLPLVIVLAATLQPENPYVVGIILTINAWAGLARSIRSQVLTLRDESYVEASRIIGVSTGKIVRRDILPNIMPYVLVNFVQSAREVIFASVGLYFLGLLPFTTANWGVILNLAYNNGALYTPGTVHWLVLPMVAIIGLSFSFILVAQAMDRLFNPRLRARHSDHVDEPEAHPSD